MATKVAIAVDALVFGQLYEEVFADAKRLCAAEDKILNGKVASFFESLSQERHEDILKEVSEPAVEALRYVSTKCHTAPDKLAMCVRALEYIDGNRGLTGDEVSEKAKWERLGLKSANQASHAVRRFSPPPPRTYSRRSS